MLLKYYDLLTLDTIHFFNVIFYGREEAALCQLPRYIIIRDGMLDEDDVVTNDVTTHCYRCFKCYMIHYVGRQSPVISSLT